ncbi:TPA: hypothetical protein OGU99_000765 [Escherichia coli]|nr:hypothetical protein A4_115 [Escherichia phage A4]HCQ0858832.1 hypothetical protein [Escherichia coli]
MVDELDRKIDALYKSIETNEVTVYYGRQSVQQSNSCLRLTITLDSRDNPYTCVFKERNTIEWIGWYIDDRLSYLYDFENYDSSEVYLNSSEEELFQLSLIEKHVMSYDNLQKIKSIMNYALSKVKQ